MINQFASRVAVRKLSFFFAGSAAGQVVRPFQTRYDQGIAQLALEATQGGTNLTSGAFTPIASSIIMPKGQHEGIAQIPNGWEQPRLSFLMEVGIINDFSNVENIMALSGYTDYDGIGQMGSKVNLDQKMRLYFNSCVRMMAVNVPTANGVAQRLQSRVSEQILRPTLLNSPGAQGNEYTMRPTDVVSAGGSACIMQASGVKVDNYTPGFTSQGVKLANRADLLGSHYLSRSVRSFAQASTEVDDTYTHADIASIASGTLNNHLLEGNVFLSMLANRFDFNDPTFGGSISFGELLQLDPNADHIAQVIMPSPVQRQHQQLEIINSNGWGGSDNETIAANIVAQAMPTIMARFMLGRAAFSITNDTLTGEPVVQWENLQGFTDGLDVRPHIGSIQEMINNTILAPITMNNQLTASLSVDYSLYANSTMLISINGGAPVPFNSPTFADQLFSPLYARQYDTVIDIGADIVNLAHELSSQQYSANYSTGANNGIITGI